MLDVDVFSMLGTVLPFVPIFSNLFSIYFYFLANFFFPLQPCFEMDLLCFACISTRNYVLLGNHRAVPEIQHFAFASHQGMQRWSARSPLSLAFDDSTLNSKMSNQEQSLATSLNKNRRDLRPPFILCSWAKKGVPRSTPRCSMALNIWATPLVWSSLPWRTDATEPWWASQLHSSLLMSHQYHCDILWPWLSRLIRIACDFLEIFGVSFSTARCVRSVLRRSSRGTGWNRKDRKYKGFGQGFGDPAGTLAEDGCQSVITTCCDTEVCGLQLSPGFAVQSTLPGVGWISWLCFWSFGQNLCEVPFWDRCSA